MVPAAHDVIVAWPEQPQQLFLLLHGLGQAPADMLPLAQRLARQFPQGLVACLAAPEAHEGGEGYQWYALQGVTEQNRIERITPALQQLVQRVQAWQQHAGTGAERTALVCYSQAAILGLEAVARHPHFCARLFAIGGRYAELPASVHAHTTLHWLHGKQDSTVPYHHAIDAAHHLKALDADFSVDVYADAGHAITQEMEDRVLHLLQNHVPQRLWREALAGAGMDEADMPRPPPPPVTH